MITVIIDLSRTYYILKSAICTYFLKYMQHQYELGTVFPYLTDEET
jgi:hypothetical protein